MLSPGKHWLRSLDGKIDIHANNNIAFKHSCTQNHLVLAQWLLPLTESHYNCQPEVFQSACYQGHLKMAEWLCSIVEDKNIPHIPNEFVFLINCEEGRLEIVQLMWKLNPTYDLSSLSPDMQAWIKRIDSK